MEVILLSDVDKVGLRGEVVDVARGYARNFLLPRRLAEEATPGRVAELRRRAELLSRQEARNAEQAAEIAAVLRKTVLSFDVKAGPTGSLFGSVTPTDIADEIWRTRKIRVDRRKIGLDEPLKRIGRYEVPVTVFEGVEVEVKTLVVPEGGELPPEEELEAMAAAEAAAQEATEEAGDVDALEAAVEELEAAEAEETAHAEPAAGEPPASDGDTAVEEAAPEVPEDAFDRVVDEAVGAEAETDRPPA
jgi:large subunit ribosomal protein L9